MNKGSEMSDEVMNKERRSFLRASGQIVTGVVVGASTVSAKSTAVKQPAVVG